MQPETFVLILRSGLAFTLLLFLYIILHALRKDFSAPPVTGQAPVNFLIAIAGLPRSHKFPLALSNIIGRAPTSTIQIEDETISTIHARISFIHNQWMLEDLGSRNGTYLNDTLIEEITIVVIGDRIRLGKVVFLITSSGTDNTEPAIPFPE